MQLNLVPATQDVVRFGPGDGAEFIELDGGDSDERGQLRLELGGRNVGIRGREPVGRLHLQTVEHAARIAEEVERQGGPPRFRPKGPVREFNVIVSYLFTLR